MKILIASLICLFPLTVVAQQPTPKSPPPPKAPSAPAAKAPPAPPGTVAEGPFRGIHPVNIRVDVAVFDQKDVAVAEPKTLMVILADMSRGQTRAAYEDRSIAVDARPTIVEGLVHLTLTVQSQQPSKFPDMPISIDADKTRDPLLNWTNSFALLLQSGKPQVAFETFDPVTKRKLSIEVKATIQK